MRDWLNNELEIGGAVVYSSKSTLTGMNLGELLFIDENKAQIRLWAVTGSRYRSANIVTLHRNSSAYKSITRYFGKIPNRSSDG